MWYNTYYETLTIKRPYLKPLTNEDMEAKVGRLIFKSNVSMRKKLGLITICSWSIDGRSIDKQEWCWRL